MAQDPNPYGNYYFVLELDKSEVGHFMECSGLKTSAQVFEIEEGGLNGRTHKRPGQSRWENIVLKYATNTSLRLLEWRDRFLQDQWAGGRLDGSIALKNNAGETVRQWHFKNAWPVSWEGPSLNSAQSELAIETLEIAHEGLTVSNG